MRPLRKPQEAGPATLRLLSPGLAWRVAVVLLLSRTSDWAVAGIVSPNISPSVYLRAPAPIHAVGFQTSSLVCLVPLPVDADKTLCSDLLIPTVRHDHARAHNTEVLVDPADAIASDSNSRALSPTQVTRKRVGSAPPSPPP